MVPLRRMLFPLSNRLYSMRLLCVHSLLFLLVPLCTVWANQLPSALLESIYPPSGTQGTKVDLTIKGTFLEGAHLLQFSAPSIKATPKKNEEGEVVANAFVVEIPPDLAVGRYSVSVGGGKRLGAMTTAILS